MMKTSEEDRWRVLYPDGICRTSNLVRSVLDKEIMHLPRQQVSDHATRYPVDAPSMRAFLEIVFTRHLDTVATLQGFSHDIG